MNCTDWSNLLIGAAVGAILGLIISELRLALSAWRKKRKLKKHFECYNGEYGIETKGGQESLIESVTIQYSRKNVLDITIQTKTNGKAKGSIIMDESTLAYGKAFYKHIDKGLEHYSGFYEIIFFEPGIIHAKVSYMLAKTREEISEFYIWTIKK